MAVTAIIVLGDRIKPHLEEVNIEQWFMSYIGMAKEPSTTCSPSYSIVSLIQFSWHGIHMWCSLMSVISMQICWVDLRCGHEPQRSSSCQGTQLSGPWISSLPPSTHTAVAVLSSCFGVDGFVTVARDSSTSAVSGKKKLVILSLLSFC